VRHRIAEGLKFFVGCFELHGALHDTLFQMFVDALDMPISDFQFLGASLHAFFQLLVEEIYFGFDFTTLRDLTVEYSKHYNQ
jgi:hypothetical protein